MSTEAFELRKVIDPHKHMPKEIKDAFFDAVGEWDLSNESYVDWKVGGWSGDESNLDSQITVDKWLLEHFEEGERVIILHWW